MQTRAVMVVDGDLEDFPWEFPGESEHRSHGHLTYFIFSHLKDKYPLAFQSQKNVAPSKRKLWQTQRNECRKLAGAILEFLAWDSGSAWSNMILDAIAQHDWNLVEKVLVTLTAVDILKTTL